MSDNNNNNKQKDDKQEQGQQKKEGAQAPPPKQYLDEATGQMVSKNELKRRQKQRKKQEKDQSKGPKSEQNTATAGGKKGAGKGKKGAAAKTEDDKKQEQEQKINPAEYLNNRKNWLLGLKNQKKNPYPHKFHTTHRLNTLVSQFKQTTQKGVFMQQTVRVTGRVYSIRDAGEGLHFYDIQSNQTKVQIYANKSQFYTPDTNWDQITTNIRRGDIIGVQGRPGKTKRGQFSVAALQITHLSYCLHMLPSGKNGLKERQTRYRQRYLDMICNPGVRSTFLTRSKIINFIRSFLQDRQFVQVETPMMNIIPGGAAAKPFVTKHNELNLDLYMRIAPELYLKMLVVGGMERVFEIGKNFRNEGIDHTHNPQFTACEFYMAYADYQDLMKLTEQMISQMVFQITGGFKIKYHPLGSDDQIQIDFTPPWPRISMVKELQKILEVQIPRDFETQQTRDLLKSLIQKHEIDCDEPKTTARMLDKLVGQFIEPKCVNPGFIIEHPSIMCPLAKWHRSEKGLTQRFELFVNGNQICNAYTELNDPKVQREQFLKQAGAKKQGDQQAWEIDEGFCTALEYGLPPTAGWGIGIDRLTMLLTDQNSIKEVLLFPAMKPLPGQAGYQEKAAVTSQQNAKET